MARNTQQSNQRLRKQPKMRRVQSAHAMPLPRVEVPKTAQQRKRRNQRRRRQAYIPVASIKQVVFSARWISLLLLAIVTAALVLIGLDENFYLTVIPVDGTVSVPASEIVEASQLAGAHIFSVEPEAAAERVAEVPGVINAAVSLSWPNKVLIEVEEDSPVAVWQEGEQQFWVTGNGRLIPVRATVPGLLLIESEMPAAAAPIVVGSESEDGNTAVSPEPQANLAFIPQDVLAGAEQLRQLRPNIEKLYYRGDSGLSYQDGRGWRVFFGTGTDMNQKLVIYETIVDDLLARGLTPQYISVSNQKKPYYRAN
ncbi:MAG: FtsQ-type POTRA domain-containing protein [Ardenticatenaceae bacterium]|nr:FtsQ-type POTRA domain-containing protein [Ardenticatenaceae bacterium]MCB9442824.1 FtsQ-type POTRA domain-containing protein [Ardenticatenaceae bacterium]